ERRHLPAAGDEAIVEALLGRDLVDVDRLRIEAQAVIDDVGVGERDALRHHPVALGEIFEIARLHFFSPSSSSWPSPARCAKRRAASANVASRPATRPFTLSRG